MRGMTTSTRHNFTQIHVEYMNFGELKDKDSKWLSYKFHYWISIRFDPTAKVYVILEQPTYIHVYPCISVYPNILEYILDENHNTSRF